MSSDGTPRPIPFPGDESKRLLDRLPPDAPEAEVALLGAMLVAGGENIHVIGEVMQIIRGAGDFAVPRHGALYDVLVQLYDRNQSLDSVQVIQELRNRQLLDQMGGADYLISLAEQVPIATNAAHYARIVRDRSKIRQLVYATARILESAYNSSEPADIVIDKAEKEIFEIAETRSGNEPTALIDLVKETYDLLDKRNAEGRTLTGMATGFWQMDEMLSGLQPGEMIIIAARPSMGKAQPLDAPVLTRSGWRAMGDLRIGDALASVDGGESRVTGIYPQGRRQVYRLTFADGRSCECCAEHLWQVRYRGWDGPRVLSTEHLIEMLNRKRYRNRVWIDAFTGEFGVDDDLPLDPWLLGVLLGDGTLGGSSVRLSSADGDLVARAAAAAGDDMQASSAGGYDYRLTQRGGAHRTGVRGVQPNPVKSALQQLDLWDRRAEAKFVPDSYKAASRDSRRRLLSGLLDTDGWVERWGSIRFATSSLRLADDVVELVRSLGGTASHHRKATTYTYRGAKRAGQTSHVCNIQIDNAQSLFTLKAKRDRLALPRTRRRRLNIVSIEPSRFAQTQCIAVSHPAHLYITEQFIVTHNTAFALNMAEYMAMDNHQPVAVFSLEMSKQQLAQRLMSSRSGVDAQRMRRNMLSPDEFRRLQEIVSETYEAPMYIDDTPGLSILELRAKARRLAIQHDIKAIFVDYMQLMSSPGAESRQQEVSEISRGVKALARELRVPVVCLSQLNRNPEGRESKKPMLSDLRESGSIEQDADVVMMIHREDYYNQAKDDFVATNQAQVIIAKQRNGPTGVVDLQFDGNTTRFHNLARGISSDGGGYPPPRLADTDAPAGDDPPF